MVTEQLLDYIKKQIERGVSQEEIKTNLKSVGWSEVDINEALRLVSSSESISLSPSLPSMTPPSQKPKIGLAKIIIGIFIILLVGAGTALASRVWDPLWNPFRPSPEKVIEQMIKKMAEVKTFHNDINFELDIENGEKFNIKGNLQSDSDITDPQNKKSKAVFNGSLTIEGTEFSLSMESIEIGETSYIKFTTIPVLLHPLFALIGINLEQLKNQWIKIDEESTRQFLKQFMSEEEFEKLKKELEEEKKEQEIMIEKFKEIIKNKKLYLVKKQLADQKVGDKKAYHYLVALNNEEIKKIIPELPGISDIFSSLSGARLKAKQARIIVNMGQIRSGAEIIYSDEGSYRNVNCNYTDIISIACKDIEEQGATKPIIYSNKDNYCAFTSSPIKGYYYCIDSSEFKVVTTNINPQETGYCNGKTFVCPPASEISETAYIEAAKEEFRRDIEKFFEKFGELSAEIWIGKKDNYLYKIKIEKEIDASQFEEIEKGTITIKADMEFSNFNQPVQIEAPKEFKTLQEIFKSLFEEEGHLMGATDATAKAKDVKIRANLSQMRVMAELYFSNQTPESYTNLCTDKEITALRNDIIAQGGTNYSCNVQTGIGAGKSYCIEVKLNSGDWYCIDSSGRFKQYTTDPACAPCINKTCKCE